MEESQKPSSSLALTALIVANFIPIWGAFFRGWSVYEIISIYWIENVTVGIVNLLKLLTNRHQDSSPAQRLSLSAFFTIHYGIFCAGHAAFVFSVLDQTGPSPIMGSRLLDPAMAAIAAYPLAFTGFLMSHLFSFFMNYHAKGESMILPLGKVMFLPYPRIFVLHVTIILGAIAVQALGSPKALVLILVAAKTFGDIMLHKREHRATKKPASQGGLKD